MKLIAGIKQEFDCKLPLRKVFEFPTPETLCTQIETGKTWTFDPLLALKQSKELEVYQKQYDVLIMRKDLDLLHMQRGIYHKVFQIMLDGNQIQPKYHQSI
jgi:hypothetical protein